MNRPPDPVAHAAAMRRLRLRIEVLFDRVRAMSPRARGLVS